jgi:hypothetical protein
LYHVSPVLPTSLHNYILFVNKNILPTHVAFFSQICIMALYQPETDHDPEVDQGAD